MLILATLAPQNTFWVTPFCIFLVIFQSHSRGHLHGDMWRRASGKARRPLKSNSGRRWSQWKVGRKERKKWERGEKLGKRTLKTTRKWRKKRKRRRKEEEEENPFYESIWHNGVGTVVLIHLSSSESPPMGGRPQTILIGSEPKKWHPLFNLPTLPLLHSVSAVPAVGTSSSKILPQSIRLAVSFPQNILCPPCPLNRAVLIHFLHVDVKYHLIIKTFSNHC